MSIANPVEFPQRADPGVSFREVVKKAVADDQVERSVCIGSFQNISGRETQRCAGIA